MTKATELRELASLTTISSGQIQFDTDIKISGDLITTGNTINITADTLNISDPNITLASGAANSFVADGAGITIDGADATINYEHGGNQSRFETNYGLYVTGSSTNSIAVLRATRSNASGSNNTYTLEVDSSAHTSNLTSAGAMKVDVNAGRAFTINGFGNVGIGHDSPDTTLHVKKNQSSAASSIKLENSAGGDDSSFDINWQLASSGTSAQIRAIRTNNPGAGDTDLSFSTSDNGTSLVEAIRIKHNGNVGIGTDNANQSLTIDHDGHGLGFGYVSSIPSNPGGMYSTAGGSTYPFNEYGNLIIKTRTDYSVYDIIMMTASTNGVPEIRMVIKDNGRVGVGGITDPVQDFEVQGSIGTNQVRHSIAPTLNFDFANSKQLDPRLSFNRDTPATYTDTMGYIRYAAENEPRFDHDITTGESKGLLLEEARTNAYQFTTFDDAATYWSIQGYVGGKNPIVRRKAAVAPDGTHSALEVYFDNTGDNAYRSWVRKCNVGANTSQAINMSFWIKSATGSNQTLRWHYGGNYGDNITVTNEWQRFVWDGSNNLSYCWGLEGPQNATAHVYIWGAQIEAGAFHTSYIPSEDLFTSRASRATYHDENGILRTASVNEPRYGYMWDGEKFVETGLIAEASKTNMITNGGYESSQNTITFTGSMTKTLHYDTAPDGSDEVVRFTWGNGYAYRYYPGVLGDSTPVAVSFYFKLYSGTYLRYSAGGSFGSMGVRLYPDGTTTWDGPHTNTIVQWARVYPVGNDWYRGEVIFQSSGSSGYTELQWSGASDFGLWGLQVEDNTWEATSFIYSGSSSTTRSADVIYSNALTRGEDRMGVYADAFDSGWYNQKESTWLTEFSTVESLNDGGYTTVIHVEGATDGGGANRYGMFAHPNYYGNPEWFASTGGGNFDIYPTSNAYTTHGGTYRKAAATYKLNDMALAVDGDLIGTDTSASPIIIADTVTFGGRLANQLGGITGHFKKIAYYPERLSNAELQALTEND